MARISHLYALICSFNLLTMIFGVCESNTNSYLWKIHSTPPIYLFGTVHVPYTKLWDYIPDNAKIAFSSSDDLCVELRLSDPTTTIALSQCQILPNGQTVDQIISPKIYQRVSNYLDRIRELFPRWLDSSPSSFLGGTNHYSDLLFNAMVNGWQRKRPIWILLLLSSITEGNIRSRKIPLLDSFMDNAAAGLGKTVRAVESVQDQCRPLNKLNTMQVELALRVQLDYLEPLAYEASGPQSSVESDVLTYRCGDFEELVKTTMLLPIPPLNNITNVTTDELGALKDMEGFLESQLVTKRNRKMTQSIDSLLQSQRNITYFFALGAGHFIGKKSVIERLENKGYTVEHIPTSELIEGPTLPSNIIALGHPESVPRLMNFQEEDEEDEESRGWELPTLSPEALSAIWDQFVVNRQPQSTPDTQTDPTTAPPPLEPVTESSPAGTPSLSPRSEIFISVTDTESVTTASSSRVLHSCSLVLLLAIVLQLFVY